MSAPPRTEIPDIKTIARELETDRLRLRSFTLRDGEAVWKHLSNPELTRNLTWATHTDRSQTQEFLVWAMTPRDTELLWAVEHRGELVGSVGLHRITYAARAWRRDQAEISYWIGAEHWKQGFATEAARAAMVFAFDELGLHKLHVSCLDDNLASRRVIEKCGFRLYGRQEEDGWRDGKWHTHLRYELLARDWSDITTTMPISMPPP